MKNSFTFLFFIFIAAASSAQSHLQWTTPEVTPGSQVNFFEGTNTDKSGNTYTINFTQDPNNHYFTYRFFRYDRNGLKQWQFNNDSCFTNCQDQYNIIVPVDDGGAFFVGYYDDISSAWSLRIKRIGLNGNLLWETNYTGPYVFARPVTAQLDHAGNLVVALKAYVTIQAQEDFAIAKFDTTNGNSIWHFEIPDGGTGGSTLSEIITSMDIDTANNVYCAGRDDFNCSYFKVSSGGILDYKFLMHDHDSISPFNGAGITNLCHGNNNDLYLLIASGIRTWVQKYDATTGAFQHATFIWHDSATVVPVGFVCDDNNIYALSNYNYFISDTTFGGGHFTNLEYMITKLDANGNTEWEKSFLENIDSLAPENATGGAAQIGFCNGHIYVLSSAVLDSAGILFNSILTKMDTAGIIDWYNMVEEHFGPGAFATDSNCNVYISRSMRLGNNYVGVVTQKFSDQAVSAVEEIKNSSTHFFVYPNPAMNEINIVPDVKELFETTIMNTLGEAILKEKNKTRLDVSALPCGIYFLRLKQGNHEEVRKFVKQ